MNEHKFCFIICTNDDLLLGECIHYINQLLIPDGYEVDLLSITDAPSITQGYNEAMAQTDAKYKIYMHQDVFILNQNILSDLLSIFHEDPKIGIIGMVGYDTVSPTGMMWLCEQRLGNLYSKSSKTAYPPLKDYRYSLSADGYSLAAEVDGFFLATSQDLPWNTQILKGWDFYDAFQSLEFLLHGYKIAVPTQRHPWCLHDDNRILNLFGYDTYRQAFLNTYKDILGKHYSKIQ